MTRWPMQARTLCFAVGNPIAHGKAPGTQENIQGKLFV